MSRRSAIPILLLIGLCVAAYGDLGQLGFVMLDDPGYVTQNLDVWSGLSAEGFQYAFTSTRLANWHPLTWLSHMAVVEAFGFRSATAHHWVNWALHAGASVFLFLFLREATRAAGRSFFVAALFAVHPLHVESVAWIAERKDVLSTFFWFVSSYAYARWARDSRAALAAGVVVGFALGLMSKAMLVTLPCTFLLLDVWPLRRTGEGPNEPSRGQHRLLMGILFGLAIVFSVLTFAVQQDTGAVGEMSRFPLAARLANAVTSCGAYVQKTFWPTDLAVFYPYPAAVDVAGATLWGVLLVSVSAAAVALLRRFPPLFVGWFWFLGTLVPVIGIIQVGDQAYADRYTYVPHVGLFVAIVWGVAALLERAPRLRAIGTALGVLVLAGCVWRSREQVLVWRDDESLFGHALEVTEGNYLAHDLYGRVLQQSGRVEEAISNYRAALDVRSDFASSWVNLGVALLSRGDVPGAIDCFESAIEARPDFSTAYANLAGAYGKSGQHGKAIEVSQKALRINPDDPAAHMNLAIALLLSRDARAATHHFRRALESNPGYSVQPPARDYAWLLATHPDPTVRDGAAAVDVATRYATAHPDDLRALETLAAALAEVGRFPEAVGTAERALDIAQRMTRTRAVSRIEAALQRLRGGQPLRSGTPVPRDG